MVIFVVFGVTMNFEHFDSTGLTQSHKATCF